MALIKCKECGHEVSDMASACPNCGCPIDGPADISIVTEKSDETTEKVSSLKSKRGKLVWIAAVSFLFVLLGVGAFIFMRMNGNSTQDNKMAQKSDSLQTSIQDENEVHITPEFCERIRKYEMLGDFHEGMAAAVRKVNGVPLLGYINTKGEEVIPCKFKFYYYGDYGPITARYNDFHDGLAEVLDFDYESGFTDVDLEYKGIKVSVKHGFINKKGEMVVPFTENYIYDFSEGLAATHGGYIDKSGRLVINRSQLRVDENARLHIFSDGLALVEDYPKCFFINNKGKVVIDCSQYYYVSDFSEGLAAVLKCSSNGEIVYTGFIDKSGKRVIDCMRYIGNHENVVQNFIRPFSEGLAAVCKDGRVGYIDKKGELVIPFLFYSYPAEGRDDAEDFHEGLCYVYCGESFANRKFIDKHGKTAFECCDYLCYGSEFSNGVVSVSNNDEYSSYCDKEVHGYCDKKGNTTFTKAELALIKKKYEEDKAAAEAREAKLAPQWAQGCWYFSGYGSMVRVVISVDNIEVYSNNRLDYRGSYEIQGDEIHYPMGDGCEGSITMDRDREVLMADDTHCFYRSAEEASRHDVESASQKSMTRLRKLQNEGRELLDEMSAMRNSGQMDPMRLVFIKRNLIRCKEEQISIAEDLGDRNLVYQYRQQLQQLMTALSAMDP